MNFIRFASINRKFFLKILGLIGLFSQIRFLYSCDYQHINKKNLSNDEEKALEIILEILFPDDGFGPKIQELNCIAHIKSTLNDIQFSEINQNRFWSGLKIIQEESQKKYGASFINLEPENQDDIIKNMNQTEMGRKWLTLIIDLILESLLASPIYGVNRNKNGWKWLKINDPIPQPNESLKYPEILKELASK